MKKFIITMLLLIYAAAGIFATDIGFGIMAGAGFYDRYDVYSLYKDRDNKNIDDHYQNNIKYGDFGFYGFLSWKYADINLGFLYKAGNYVDYSRGLARDYSTADSRNISFGSACFQIGAYLKYPFRLSSKVRLFPAIGADVEVQNSLPKIRSNYSGVLKGPEGASTEFWMRFGLGVDVHLKRNMFLHSTALYGVDFLPYAKDRKGFPGHGFLIKVGLGWML